MKIDVPKKLIESDVYQAAGHGVRNNLAMFCYAVASEGGSETFVWKEERLDNKGWCQIPQSRLERYVSRKQLPSLRQQLAKAEVVECDNTFSYRIKDEPVALSYRFAADIRSEDFVPVEISNKWATDKLDKILYGKPVPYLSRRDDLLPIHRQLSSKLELFTLNTPDADAFLSTLSGGTHVSAAAQLRNIRNEQFYFSIGKTNRVTTTFSNLKKEFRPMLSVGGEAVALLDVSACQPLILAYVMRDKIEEEELKKYQDLVESGQFYIEIADFAGVTDKELKKNGMLRYLFGPVFEVGPKWLLECDNPDPDLYELLTMVNVWFCKNFPGVRQFLIEEKKRPENVAKYWGTYQRNKKKRKGMKDECPHPYAAVAHTLQKLEAKVVIEDTCSALLKREPGMPILTVHDELIVPQSKAEMVYEQLRTSFAEYGLSPNIKRHI
jgi:hypothetical protein